jgi:hypothetical protein
LFNTSKSWNLWVAETEDSLLRKNKISYFKKVVEKKDEIKMMVKYKIANILTLMKSLCSKEGQHVEQSDLLHKTFGNFPLH